MTPTQRHRVAEAIAEQAAVMFEYGNELVVDGEVSSYEYEWRGPQTFRVTTQGQEFDVHVRSRR